VPAATHTILKMDMPPRPTGFRQPLGDTLPSSVRFHRKNLQEVWRKIKQFVELDFDLATDILIFEKDQSPKISRLRPCDWRAGTYDSSPNSRCSFCRSRLSLPHPFEAVLNPADALELHHQRLQPPSDMTWLSAFYSVNANDKRATQPCPCGYFGDLKRECRCSPNQVQKYRQRISGPLLDRIDIHVEVPAVHYKDISSKAAGEASSEIGARVGKAREIQQHRFRGNARTSCNARMTPRMLKAFCILDEAGADLIKMAMTELNFSARAYDRILKVARTIADLAGEENIQAMHIGEAIQYRTLDRNLWM